MTDERMGHRLLPSIAALPRGSGIIFRHYSLPRSQRRALFGQVHAAARAGCHCLLVAGRARDMGSAKAAGVHGRDARRTHGVRSAPVHSVREIIAATRAGADLLFVSPVFATRSHPGERTLGRVRLGLLIRATRLPVIALGGMSGARARSLRALGVYGWAAIDSLTV